MPCKQSSNALAEATASAQLHNADHLISYKELKFDRRQVEGLVAMWAEGWLVDPALVSLLLLLILLLLPSGHFEHASLADVGMAAGLQTYAFSRPKCIENHLILP